MAFSPFAHRLTVPPCPAGVVQEIRQGEVMHRIQTADSSSFFASPGIFLPPGLSVQCARLSCNSDGAGDIFMDAWYAERRANLSGAVSLI